MELLLTKNNKILEKESITCFHDYKDTYCEWCYKYGDLIGAELVLITDKEQVKQPYCNFLN